MAHPGSGCKKPCIPVGSMLSESERKWAGAAEKYTTPSKPYRGTRHPTTLKFSAKP